MKNIEENKSRKTIPEFPDYMATIDGNIISKKTGKILKQKIGPNGYYMINLSILGKCKTFTVHRLIAKTFIPNLSNLPEINHIDGNKKNNNVSNLEWCTYKYNINHAIENHLFIPAKGIKTLNGRFTENDIHQIRKYKSQGYSNAKIAKIYKVTRGAIQQIVSKKTYKWVI